MQSVARRIVDGEVLHLIRMWLAAPVEERDENGKRRLTGGKERHCGTPQGGVASPMLANLHMNASRRKWEIVWYPAIRGWAEVRDQLKSAVARLVGVLQFSYGTRAAAYRAVDPYVYQSVRHFLRRRRQVPSRGTRRFRREAVFGEWGILRLGDVPLNPRS